MYRLYIKLVKNVQYVHTQYTRELQNYGCSCELTVFNKVVFGKTIASGIHEMFQSFGTYVD